jgi:hypothetical protein
MTYGVEFRNDDDVVTIDSVYARLVVVAKGRFASTGMDCYTYFPSPVTSQEPPLVFVRPDTVAAVAGLCRVVILGSAGNWTGFYVRAYDFNTAKPKGDYFAAAFKASPVADYGMRIWGEDGGIIFDSGTPCAVFTKSYTGWSRIKSDTNSQGQTRVYFSVPFDFSSGDYMLINNFSMHMAGASSRDVEIYCWWDFPGNRLWALTIGVTNQTTMYLPAVFAKT